ncbi:MAG: methylated-DNA--[protein]-cysteine S-methyltransferase [Actinomycetota bacterium]|nr:methylated-DNA--[protein]-cysteine S-methyltransferase [Actinomycetota bacterium]
MTYFTTVTSPIGSLLLTTDNGALTGLRMGRSLPDPTWVRDDARFERVVRQLDEYWTGNRTDFDIDLEPIGTPFQLKVWAALRSIPYGTTISYAELARRVGNPRAMRAVGRANGANPIAVIVPCHRVIAADGTLGGFGGGLTRKQKLLRLEGSLK